MSGRIDTESIGSVGIYRKKNKYTLCISNPVERAEAEIELTEDELYRLIYMASKDVRRLVNIGDSARASFFHPSATVSMLQEAMEGIPTEAEITKRRRAAQRKKRL